MARTRLVIFDLDLTLWDNPDPTLLREPLRKLDETTVVDAEGKDVHLYPGVKKMLKEFQERGVTLSVASWNKPDMGKKLLKLFGIEGYFRHPKIQFHPNKHLMIKETLKEFRDEGLSFQPHEILYVDDRTIHLQAIRKEIGNIRFVQIGAGIKRLEELLRWVENPTVDDF